MDHFSFWWIGYPILGACVSLIAGLFGIGGGFVIVPVLYVLFTYQGFPYEHLMHVVLGTTMMSMIVTSITAANAHRKLGNVDWSIVRVMGIGLAIGSVGGSSIASLLPTVVLSICFGVIVFMVALYMISDAKPKPTRQLPSSFAQFSTSIVFGILAALVGATGGFIITPYLAWHNIQMKKAIGAAAAIGVPVAITGTIGYLVAGLSAHNLPPLTIGFVNVPALLGIVSCSSLFVSTGAKIASNLDGDKMKRIFGWYLLVVSIKMLYSSLT